MNDTNQNRPLAQTSAPGISYRPEMAFYHPNALGTGCAVKLSLHPAHDDVEGSIFVTLANQMTIGDRRGPTPVYPHFDWENSICVRLQFADLCPMLQVFRGECESIAEGKGLFHRTKEFYTNISLKHLTEPDSCYSLSVFRTRPGAANGETHAHFTFSAGEALGLSEAIAGSMAVICFGIPMVVPHVAVRGAADSRKPRNGTAAA